MIKIINGSLSLCIALCLGLIWACVKVDVSVLSQERSRGIPSYLPLQPPISIDKLKKLHTKKFCTPSTLEVTKEQQQTPAWCWAASTRMAMEFQNKKHNNKNTDLQCEIVNEISGSSLNGSNCCNDNTASQCTQGGWPNRVLDYYQFDYQWIAGALDDWDALKGEICSIGPFISVIEWDSGGKHTFVVKGYDSLPGQQKQTVEVYDPLLNDPQDMTFEEFVGDSPRKQYGFHGFSHYQNFVQIQPKATKDQP